MDLLCFNTNCIYYDEYETCTMKHDITVEVGSDGSFYGRCRYEEQEEKDEYMDF